MYTFKSFLAEIFRVATAFIEIQLHQAQLQAESSLTYCTHSVAHWHTLPTPPTATPPASYYLLHQHSKMSTEQIYGAPQDETHNGAQHASPGG
eukprot:SAG22_NODE_15727_length_342_cov_0.843621_1_plen_92_part_10